RFVGVGLAVGSPEQRWRAAVDERRAGERRPQRPLAVALAGFVDRQSADRPVWTLDFDRRRDRRVDADLDHLDLLLLGVGVGFARAGALAALWQAEPVRLADTGVTGQRDAER